MPIKNKFEKFLMSATGILLASAVIMGIKVKDDGKKLETITKALAAGTFDNNLGKNQQMIGDTRYSIIDTVSKAPAPDVEQTATVKTVVPGKVVKEVVPVATKSGSSSAKSSSSSSKANSSTSSTSSSSNTTKTS